MASSKPIMISKSHNKEIAFNNIQTLLVPLFYTKGSFHQWAKEVSRGCLVSALPWITDHRIMREQAMYSESSYRERRNIPSLLQADISREEPGIYVEGRTAKTSLA
jgi:hypothetical protein